MANMASACAMVLSNRSGDQKNILNSMRTWNSKGAASSCILVTVSAICIVFMVVSGVWLAREHLLSSGYEESVCWVSNVTYYSDQPCQYCINLKEKNQRKYYDDDSLQDLEGLSSTSSSCKTIYFPCLRVIVTYYTKGVSHDALLYQDSLQASGVHNKCSFYVCRRNRDENAKEVTNFADSWIRRQRLYQEQHKKVKQSKLEQKNKLYTVSNTQKIFSSQNKPSNTRPKQHKLANNSQTLKIESNESLKNDFKRQSSGSISEQQRNSEIKTNMKTLFNKRKIFTTKTSTSTNTTTLTTASTTTTKTATTTRISTSKSATTSLNGNNEDGTFVCFYNKKNFSDVIRKKVYSTWDVINGMLWPGLVFLTCCIIFLRIETKRRHLTFCGIKEDHKQASNETTLSRSHLSYRESISSHVHPVSTTLTLLEQGKMTPYGNAVCDVAQKGHFNVKKVPYEENLRHQILLQQQLHSLQQSSHHKHQYHKQKRMSKQWSEDVNFQKRLPNKVKQHQHRKHSINICPNNIDSLGQRTSQEHSCSNFKHRKSQSLSSNVQYYSLSTLKLHNLDDAVGEVCEEEFDENSKKKDFHILCQRKENITLEYFNDNKCNTTEIASASHDKTESVAAIVSSSTTTSPSTTFTTTPIAAETTRIETLNMPLTFSSATTDNLL